MKKGFTLVELLAVIIVLSIVFSFVATNVMKSIDKAADDEYKLLSSILENAAEIYIEEEAPEELEESGGTYCVTLENLASKGLISLPITNPYDDTDYDTSTCTLVLNLTENQNYYEFNATEPNFHLELNGDSSVTLDCNKNGYYDDPGARIVTPAGNSVNTIYADTLLKNEIGSNTLTYEAYSGSTLIDSITRSVTINNSNTPSITITGGNTMSITKGSTFVKPNGFASDACEMSIPVTTSGTVDTNTVGDYTVTYSATNLSGQTTNQDLTVSVWMPVVNETFTATITTSGYQSYIIPYDGTYRIQTFGGGCISYGGASMRGDFVLNAGDEILIMAGKACLGVAGGAGGTFVAKVVTSSSYQTYQGDYVEPLIVSGAASGNADGLATIGTTGNGGVGDGGGGGGGFATDGGNATATGGKSFLNGGAGGPCSTGVNGAYGGGGGEDDDGGGTADDGGGSGGYDGGNGEMNSSGYPGKSYNNGTNQSNLTGGAVDGADGYVTLELISM